MFLNAVAAMVTSVVANDDSILPNSRKTLCMAIEQNQTGNGCYGCDVTMYIYIYASCMFIMFPTHCCTINLFSVYV